MLVDENSCTSCNIYFYYSNLVESRACGGCGDHAACYTDACLCNPGYSRNPQDACLSKQTNNLTQSEELRGDFLPWNIFSDIDECTADANACWNTQTCIDTDGSFYCECISGYTKNTPDGPCVPSQWISLVSHVLAQSKFWEYHKLLSCGGISCKKQSHLIELASLLVCVWFVCCL